MPQLNQELLRKNAASHEQVNYILILLNDIGIGERDKQLAHLKDWARRKKLDAIGDLTKYEASICIGRLKEIRDGQSS